jgi:hypothetical protein
LPFASANGYLNAPALPILCGFYPLSYRKEAPLIKGLKPTEEEALPPVFYIRRLKTDGKREPAAQGVAL